MSNNVLTNLSKWFEVPVGATIPANTLYAILYSDGSHSTVSDDGSPFRVEKAGRFFTEKPIEVVRETLEDVIREGVGGVHTPAEIAKAVEAFYAEQKKGQPRVIIDDAGEDEWRPITDPDEAANWKKAEKMYRTAYSSLDDAWEYQSQYTKDRWYTLAQKYVEKKD